MQCYRQLNWRNKEPAVSMHRICNFGISPVVSCQWSFVSCDGVFRLKDIVITSNRRHCTQIKRNKVTKSRIHGIFRIRDFVVALNPDNWVLRVVTGFFRPKDIILPQVVVIAHEQDEKKSEGHVRSKSAFWGTLLDPENGILWVVTGFFSRKGIIITSSCRHCTRIRCHKEWRARTLQIRVLGGAPVSWPWSFVTCDGFFQS